MTTPRLLTPAERERLAEQTRRDGCGWSNQRYVVAYRCPFCGANTWRHICNPPKPKGELNGRQERYC